MMQFSKKKQKKKKKNHKQTNEIEENFTIKLNVTKQFKYLIIAMKLLTTKNGRTTTTKYNYI